MTERRVTEQRTAGERSARRLGAGYRLFSCAVLVAGLLVTALELVKNDSPWAFNGEYHWGANMLLPFVLLAIGFLITELAATDINVRRIDWTISFTEIPVVIGLMCAPFPTVLAAYLIVGLAMQARRTAGRHLIYNAGVMCLDIAVPFAIMRAIEPGAGSIPVWFMALIAVLISSMLSTALGICALQTLGAGLTRAAVTGLALRTMVFGLLSSTLGAVGTISALKAPWGPLMAVLLALAMGAVAYAHSRLLREQRDLGALSEISLAVARLPAGGVVAPDDDEGCPRKQWVDVAEQIRDQIGADRVMLHLLIDETDSVRTVVAGSPLPDQLGDPGALWRDDPLLRPSGNEVRYHQRGGSAEDIAAALRLRGAHEALVVPLRNSTRLLGAVEAHDKASSLRGFGRPDVRLLRTVANHLSTATDNHRLVTRLRHDAYHDPQTGLLNRAGFLSAAAQSLEKGRCGGLLRVDIDVLSTVGEALGYAWGDRMVVFAGERLREQLGEQAPIARLQGGAFAVLLRDDVNITEIASTLRASLSAPYPIGKLTVEASAFLGYTAVPEAGTEEPDADTLLQQADVALRTARGGGDVVREYSPTMGSIFLRRFQLVTQFRRAVERGEVRVNYQPKIALPSRQLLGAEALVRWQHPEFGELAPDEFVPSVEATGLIDVLTTFVTDQALAKVRSWLDDGVRMSISVNLSVRSLDDASLPDKVAEALAAHDVPAELLTFEITESGVMAAPERAIPVLRRLHALGVLLALDDFGTGYSSLAYLRQLPVDEVKIDKSFVLGMGSDLGDLAVVRSIVDLSHSLGLIVVAEGVEDDAARDALIGMSCDVAQGYLISRPLSEERFAQWLVARTMREHDDSDSTILTLVS